MLGVAANLALLGLFKYADFAVGTLNAVVGDAFSLPSLALPLGISFFTFHAISYLIDVNWLSLSEQLFRFDKWNVCRV